MPTRVLLADDSRKVVESVRALLEAEGFQVIGAAHDGEQALGLAIGLEPEVVVLDHAMPRMTGLQAARAIRKVCPRVRLIFLTQYDSEHLVIAAFRAGSRGFVVKRDTGDLPRAIREVARGSVFLSPGACAAVMQPYLDPPSHPA